MNTDHAPRIRAQQQQAAENAAMQALEQSSAPLFWAVFVAAVLLAMGLSMHLVAAWKASAARECPPAQYGERLLSSEQQPGKTVCYYADGWASYGHNVKSRSIHGGAQS
jgi:hypothetical protein